MAQRYVVTQPHVASVEFRYVLSYQLCMDQPQRIRLDIKRVEKTSLGSRTNYHCESGLWPLKLV